MSSDDDLPLELAIDRRLPSTAQIYDALRAAILDLRLKPGMPISENRICRQTSVSRTPVREAIIRLAQEGLIDVFPQYGSFIAPISLRKVIEGHFIRETLEIAMLKRASIGWGCAETKRIECVIAAQRAKAAANDHPGFYREDENFHRSFAAIAGMDGVSSVIKDANTHLARVRQLANPFEGHMEAAIADHQAILDALKTGHADVAATRLHQHLDRVFETVTKLVHHHSKYFKDVSNQDALRMVEAAPGKTKTSGTKRTKDAAKISVP